VVVWSLGSRLWHDPYFATHLMKHGLIVRELAWCFVEVAEEEAHRLRCGPIHFVYSAGPDVFGLEGFDEVAEFLVRRMARIREGLRGIVNNGIGNTMVTRYPLFALEGWRCAFLGPSPAVLVPSTCLHCLALLLS